MDLNDTYTMPAGPELDRLVAEKVMGYRHDPELGLMDGERILGVDGAWSPSTNIAHAWQVVERISSPEMPRNSRGWPPSTVFMHWFNLAELWAERAPDAALAICRAALFAAV